MPGLQWRYGRWSENGCGRFENGPDGMHHGGPVGRRRHGVEHCERGARRGGELRSKTPARSGRPGRRGVRCVVCVCVDAARLGVAQRPAALAERATSARIALISNKSLWPLRLRSVARRWRQPSLTWVSQCIPLDRQFPKFLNGQALIFARGDRWPGAMPAAGARRRRVAVLQVLFSMRTSVSFMEPVYAVVVPADFRVRSGAG